MEFIIYTLLFLAYICIGLAVSIIIRIVKRDKTSREFDRLAIWSWPVALFVAIFIELTFLLGKLGDWIFFKFVVPIVYRRTK